MANTKDNVSIWDIAIGVMLGISLYELMTAVVDKIMTLIFN